MKKILVAVTLCMTAMLSAQNPAERYEQRYDMLVSQFGAAGVGVETVLDNWEKVDSTNAKLLLARFNYLFTKAQSVSVVMKDNKKYLGMEPILTFKDSLQRNVYCYQETFFDDELYGKAVKAVDKAISFHPDRLDFRFVKANALIAYEKESPDMALACLMELADENLKRKSSWEYDGQKADQQFFQEAMQEYCFSFYTLGTQSGYEAFRQLSEKLSVMFPDNTEFVNNIGSYYLIAKEDYKTAYKYYNKVLKAHPDDMTAIRNGLLAARKQKNLKQEKKYLEMMVKYGSERDRLQAEGRLKAMKK